MALSRPLVRWKMAQWLLAVYFNNFFDVSGRNVLMLWTEIDPERRFYWIPAWCEKLQPNQPPSQRMAVAAERDPSPFQTCPARTDKPPGDLQYA